VAQAKHVPLVPMTALSRHGGETAAAGDGAGGRYSVRVLRDDKVEVRQVTVGVTNRMEAEVRAGLEPGDQVVTSRPATKPANGRMRTPHL